MTLSSTVCWGGRDRNAPICSPQHHSQMYADRTEELCGVWLSKADLKLRVDLVLRLHRPRYDASRHPWAGAACFAPVLAPVHVPRSQLLPPSPTRARGCAALVPPSLALSEASRCFAAFLPRATAHAAPAPPPYGGRSALAAACSAAHTCAELAAGDRHSRACSRFEVRERALQRRAQRHRACELSASIVLKLGYGC